MAYTALRRRVYNRGIPPIAFLQEMVAWARTAPDEIFSANQKPDIYNKVRFELGPYLNLRYRKAVMLEVMRVLAGFESSWNWKEGVDTSRAGSDTAENSEAGAWQVSYDARRLAPELQDLLLANQIKTGAQFQRIMKANHLLAMEFVARLLRHNTKHNGPLYKGNERFAIRRSLRDAEHSIYPWLSKPSVNEFIKLLS